MTKDKILYQLDDERVTTVRAEFIRQEFSKGKSRGEIVELLNKMGDKVNYGTVAGATVNMKNETLKKQGGRIYLEFEDGTKMPRKEYIIEQIVNEKRTISDVAKELGIPYGTAYVAVKDIDIESKYITKNKKK